MSECVRHAHSGRWGNPSTWDDETEALLEALAATPVWVRDRECVCERERECVCVRKRESLCV